MNSTEFSEDVEEGKKKKSFFFKNNFNLVFFY